MDTDRLYELAFQYRKTKLWDMVSDEHVFALKLSDGTIGYVSVMRYGQDYCALSLYIGDKGFDSYRRVTDALDYRGVLDEYEGNEIQDCLRCELQKRDALNEQEREKVKIYARTHGIKIAGKYAYPYFVKYKPYCYPWHFQTEKEALYMGEALEAAIALAEFVRGKMPYQLGLGRITEETKDIPMLERENGKYIWRKTQVPAPLEIEYPSPKVNNDIMAAKINKIKKSGIWECEIIRYPKPFQDGPDDVPVFPAILLCVDSKSGYILPVSPVTDYEEGPDKMLDVFMEGLLMQQIHPKKIGARDERTYAFLKNFCNKLGINLKIDDELEALDEAEEAFYERFDMSEEEEMEDLQEILNAVMKLTDEQILNLPDMIVMQLEVFMKEGIFPAEVEKRFARVLNFDMPEKEKKIEQSERSGPADSYVISVSLGTGCYRHIQISEKSTLEELSSAILDAFDFDNDHAHAFFMDNTSWSKYDCYYIDGMDGDRRTTNKFRLRELGLYKGKKFKYIFDFGDEWTFQCSALKVVKKDTKTPVVIRSVGEAPMQYGYDEWDEDGDDDDDD